ncbi:MAG: TetR/AcrR family transcriptional regulator [Pseudomonadota bacterium]
MDRKVKRSAYSKQNSPPTKMGKGLETKERIVQTAIDLFYERGYANASTRELVKRLGMTKSSIYSHFSSKDEILFTIVQRAGAKVLATLNEVNERYHDPVECLKQMISRFVSSLAVMGKESSIFASELDQLPKNYRKLCTEQHRQIFHLFRHKIGELEEKGLINPNDRTLLTFSILGSINWVYRWYNETGPLSMQDIADGMAKVLLKGLLRTDVPAIDEKGNIHKESFL